MPFVPLGGLPMPIAAVRSSLISPETWNLPFWSIMSSQTFTKIIETTSRVAIVIRYEEQAVCISCGVHSTKNFVLTCCRLRNCPQLLGALDQTKQSALDCGRLNKLGNITLNPCGFIANTLFNDVFQLQSGVSTNNDSLVMQEKGIAWASDLEYMFAQPEGFKAEKCPSGSCTADCCDGEEWSCKEPYLNEEDGECYRYFYPNDNTTQYLYEVSVKCDCVDIDFTFVMYASLSFTSIYVRLIPWW